MDERLEYFNENILVTIAPNAGSELERSLIEFVTTGGKLMLFGPVDHSGKELLNLLNLRNVSPLEGEFTLVNDFVFDRLDDGYPAIVNHRALFSGGGIRTRLNDMDDPDTTLLASFRQGAETRDVAWARAEKSWNGGKIVYVRGTNSSRFDGGRLLTPDDPEKYFIGQLFLRYGLNAFGIKYSIEKKDPGIKSPVSTISRSNNAFIFSGYCPNTTVEHHFRFPQGAPLLLGYDTEIVDGSSTYTLPTAWNRECRVFVDQPGGIVSFTELHSGQNGVSKRYRVRGLQNATVRIYAEDHVTGDDLRAYLNSGYPWREGLIAVKRGDDKFGKHFVVENITGELVVAW